MTQVVVLDRQRADVGEFIFPLRRMLVDLVNPGFAKWVASPARGRFVVVALVGGYTVEQMFMFVDSPDELIAIVLAKLRELGAGSVALAVGPAMRARIEAAAVAA